MSKFAILWAVSAITFSASSPYVAAQTNNPRSAMAEYNADNYEESVDILLAATTAATRTADDNALLGLSYFNMQNFDAALPLLEKSRKTTRINKHLKTQSNLALIEIYLARSDLEVVRRLLRQTKPSHFSEQAKKKLLLAELRLAENRHKDAIYLYTQAKEQDASLTPLVNFKISQIYVQTQELEKAKNLISQTLRSYPNRFESGQLRYNLKQINALEKPRLIAQLGYRIEYDNNVTLQPDDNSINISSPGDGRRDFRNTFTADALFKKNLPKNWRLHSEAHFYQSLHPDLSRYDETRFSMVSSPTYSKNNWSLRLPLELSYALRQQNNNERNIGIVPGITYSFANKINLHPYLNYQVTTLDAPSIPQEDRSGSFMGTGLLALIPFDDRKGAIRVLVQYGDNNTQGSNWDNSETNIISQLQYVVWRGISANIGYQYLARAYKNIHHSEILRRQDYAHLVSAKLELTLWKNWAIFAQAAYVSNISNIAFYDNTRQVISAGTYWHIR